MEFPHVQLLFDELQNKGLGLAALTSSDSPDSANQFIAYNRLTVPLYLAGSADSGGVFGKYKAAQGNYFILDGKGKIVYAGGYDMTEFRRILATLGVR